MSAEERDTRWTVIYLSLALGLSLHATGVRAQSTLTVEECVKLALARSPTALISSAESEVARQRVREARAAYWPQVLGHGEYGRSGGYDTTVTNGGSTALIASVQALLFDGGSRKAQLAAARARLRSATAAEKQRRADAALEVKTAYFAGLAAREECITYADSRRMMEADLSALQTMQREGLATRNDVLRARQAIETARSAGRTGEASLDAALAELTTLTGTEVTDDLLVEPAITDLEQPTNDTVEASPTLDDARAGMAAAQEDAEAIRSENRGRLTFNADAGFVGVGPGTTFSRHGGSQFLLGFSVPLFNGGATAARIAGAVASTDAAEENVRLARQDIDRTLQRTSIEAARARDELKAWTQQLPISKEAFRLMRARFVGGGDVRLLEVIDALNELVDTRLNITHARLSYRLAIAERERVLGRVSEP
jgi:outer membrane protein TolC